jgi:uncharacterized protein (TIGR03435 family)
MSIRIRAFLSLIGLALLARAPIHAQPSPELPSFEVVSIKPRSGAIPPGFPPQAPDRFARPDTTVSQLIAYAYEVREFQIDGGPGWLRSNHYEVSAKAERAGSADNMRLMVKRLLEERFGLKAHTETRELTTYALVTARRDQKPGEKMRPSSIDCQPIIDAGGVKPVGGGVPAQCAWFIAMMNGLARMKVDGIRMARFAELLEPMAMRTVMDKTGLSGTYDIDLEFLPDRGLPPVPAGGAPTQEAPSLFTALQDQLGLKLESERGRVKVIVIDGAEVPTAN